MRGERPVTRDRPFKFPWWIQRWDRVHAKPDASFALPKVENQVFSQDGDTRFQNSSNSRVSKKATALNTFPPLMRKYQV